MQLIFTMEHNEILSLTEQGSPEVPSLIKFIASNEVAGFDSTEDICRMNNQFHINGFQPVSSSSNVSEAFFYFSLLFLVAIFINIYLK